MRKNKTKQLLKEGKHAVGIMVSEIRTPSIAQIFATAGFDFFVIDTEHSSFSLETVQDMVWAARAGDITPIVRVPTRYGHHNLSRPLDCGAEGLLIPQVQTKEEVEQIIKATKFYPLGERGIAIRRTHTGFADMKPDEFVKWMNDETLIILQIESKEAVDNLEELIMPGVDACLIGPNDLSQSLGIPGKTKDPLVQQHIERFVEKCLRLNIPSGIHLRDVQSIEPWIRKGMQLLVCSTDIGLLVEGGRKIVQDIKTICEGR
ncbi:HpcH/HpaI aldolase family protein [Pseudothermotoga sp. U03pept]|uniref:HpcH/HpaI aldolase family protein n=1 Tax=Pseudothermotoga sp. U03pept TaxID=3447012 RepID=UPI003F097E22